MFKKIKRILFQIKDNSLLSISNFSTSIILAAFWFYLATIISPSEYGEATFLISIATMGQAAISLGLPKLIVVSGAKKENIFSAIYTLGLITSTIAVIVTYIITSNLVSSLLIWGIMIFVMMIADLNANEKFKSISILRISRRSIGTISALALLPILGINGIILGFLLGTMTGIFGLKKFLTVEKVSIKVLKNKTHFILSNYITAIMYRLFWSGDKLLIGPLFGFAFLGNYALASQYLIFLVGIPNALFTYLLPSEAKSNKNNKSLKILSILFTIFLVFISIFVVPIIIENFLPNYSNSILALQIMSLSLPAITISKIYEAMFVGKDKSKFITISSIVQIIIFYPLIIILGTQIGIEGIAISVVITAFIRCTFEFILYKKYFR